MKRDEFIRAYLVDCKNELDGKLRESSRYEMLLDLRSIVVGRLNHLCKYTNNPTGGGDYVAN